MGNALGLGLVSVVFFGSISDRLAPQAGGPGVRRGVPALAVVGGRGARVIFLVMFALPARPRQHVEGGEDEDVQDVDATPDEVVKEAALTR